MRSEWDEGGDGNAALSKLLWHVKGIDVGSFSNMWEILYTHWEVKVATSLQKKTPMREELDLHSQLPGPAQL